MNRLKHLIKSVACDVCGRNFFRGIAPDGLPNGLGFEQEDGRIINICTECLIEGGRRLKDAEEKH